MKLKNYIGVCYEDDIKEHSVIELFTQEDEDQAESNYILVKEVKDIYYRSTDFKVINVLGIEVNDFVLGDNRSELKNKQMEQKYSVYVYLFDTQQHIDLGSYATKQAASDKIFEYRRTNKERKYFTISD